MSWYINICDDMIALKATGAVDDGEGGTYMRPKLFAVPGGYPTDHLL
jgi:hypothetical protein